MSKREGGRRIPQRKRRGEERAEEGSREMEERYRRTREKGKDINMVENMMVFYTRKTKDLNLVNRLN